MTTGRINQVATVGRASGPSVPASPTPISLSLSLSDSLGPGAEGRAEPLSLGSDPFAFPSPFARGSRGAVPSRGRSRLRARLSGRSPSAERPGVSAPPASSLLSSPRSGLGGGRSSRLIPCRRPLCERRWDRDPGVFGRRPSPALCLPSRCRRCGARLPPGTGLDPLCGVGLPGAGGDPTVHSGRIPGGRRPLAPPPLAPGRRSVRPTVRSARPARAADPSLRSRGGRVLPSGFPAPPRPPPPSSQGIVSLSREREVGSRGDGRVSTEIRPSEATQSPRPPPARPPRRAPGRRSVVEIPTVRIDRLPRPPTLRHTPAAGVQRGYPTPAPAASLRPGKPAVASRRVRVKSPGTLRRAVAPGATSGSDGGSPPSTGRRVTGSCAARHRVRRRVTELPCSLRGPRPRCRPGGKRLRPDTSSHPTARGYRRRALRRTRGTAPDRLVSPPERARGPSFPVDRGGPSAGAR